MEPTGRPHLRRASHPRVERHPALARQAEERARSIESRTADRITAFAGSMRFVYLHVAWFGCWIAFGVEKYPYGLLTMIVSLEAIFLSTFVMISQNRADAKRQAIADQQWQTVKDEHAQNEELLGLSRRILELTTAIDATASRDHPRAPAVAPCLAATCGDRGSAVAAVSRSLAVDPRQEREMSTMETSQTTVAPTSWVLDEDGTSVEFTVKSFWGLMNVHGAFDRFGGSYDVGPNGTTIALTIDADSVDTGNRARDRHLRSKDFFAVAEHPQVRFLATDVHPVGDGVLHVAGTLEAAGTLVALEFDATVNGADGRLDVEATTTVDQRRFGMRSGLLGMIRPPARLHVKARLTRATHGRTRP